MVRRRQWLRGWGCVAILSRQTVYKGYGATPTEREEEYRIVVSAIQALGKIASRPGDAGSAVAAQELARLLVDDRTVGNLPSFHTQAKDTLTQVLGPLPADKTWAQWHAQYCAANKDRLRAAVPEAEVFSNAETMPAS